MSFWVVVTNHKPDRLPNIEENLARQQELGFSLCVVESGDAVGTSSSLGADLVLKSPENAAEARNTALSALRKEKSWVCFLDSDDYYSSQYLEESYQSRAHNTLIGKRPNWVHFENRGLVCFKDKGQKEVPWVIGGTISGYSHELPQFEPVPIGEDVRLCREFARSGGKILQSSIANFCYVRRDDPSSHTYVASDEIFLSEQGPWLYYHPNKGKEHCISTVPFSEYLINAKKISCRLDLPPKER